MCYLLCFEKCGMVDGVQLRMHVYVQPQFVFLDERNRQLGMLDRVGYADKVYSYFTPTIWETRKTDTAIYCKSFRMLE